EVVGTDAEVAVGAGEHFGLEPRLIFAEKFDGSGVGFGESGLSGWIGGAGGGGRQGFFGEAGGAGRVLKSDFGGDARDIVEIDLEIGASVGEKARKLFFAGDDRAQAIIGRRELANHDDVNAGRGAARVVVGIFGEGSNDLKFEQIGANTVE